MIDLDLSRLFSGSAVAGSAFVILDALLQSGDLLLSMSGSLLPVVSLIFGDFGEIIGIDQSLAQLAFVFVASAFLVHQITKILNRVRDETDNNDN